MPAIIATDFTAVVPPPDREEEERRRRLGLPPPERLVAVSGTVLIDPHGQKVRVRDLRASSGLETVEYRFGPRDLAWDEEKQELIGDWMVGFHITTRYEVQALFTFTQPPETIRVSCVASGQVIESGPVPVNIIAHEGAPA